MSRRRVDVVGAPRATTRLGSATVATAALRSRSHPAGTATPGGRAARTSGCARPVGTGAGTIRSGPVEPADRPSRSTPSRPAGCAGASSSTRAGRKPASSSSRSTGSATSCSWSTCTTPAPAELSAPDEPAAPPARLIRRLPKPRRVRSPTVSCCCSRSRATFAPAGPEVSAPRRIPNWPASSSSS